MKALILEIEYLAGVCFAAVGPDSPLPDWPPQPDRVFSALTASWAARGCDPDEAEALEWLERQRPPSIAASDAHPRTTATAYVPPNDPRVDKKASALSVMPANRRRQPRRFPATRPKDPVVRLIWVGVEPTSKYLDVLQALAHDTPYVGHSSSLTRCRFLVEGDVPQRGVRAPRRRVYAGRLAELRRRFESGYRPLPGADVPAEVEEGESLRTSSFSDKWLVLQHVGGDMPDVRSAAIVTKLLRDAILSGYDQIGLGDRIPEVVSGHAADGSPSRSPHMAIVPLPFAGFPYADGHVLGYAVVPPRGHDFSSDADFLAAFRAVAPFDGSRARRILRLWAGRGSPGSGLEIELSPTSEVVSRSLEPGLYLRPSRTFATVTPVVLDRHLKGERHERQAEIEQCVAEACRHIGLPDPERVVADKHSGLEGVPSARPSGRAPSWMQWSLPRSMASRQLTHAVIRFSEPVLGPVVLGSGRYVGLGLCRPIHERGA